MTTLFWIIVFCLLGGLLSLIAASVLLLFKNSVRTRLVPHLVSFAIGTLLGAAFLGLLPHAAAPAKNGLEMHTLALTVLCGILVFFILEKMVLWRHCHSDHCEAHNPHDHLHEGQEKSRVTLILIGDGIHNFVDGFVIAAAFLTDFHLGVVTAIAIAAHEIPQEIGDFAILLDNGLARAKALLFNALSGLATVIGGVIAFFSFSSVESIIPYVLGVAAASFIYIAVADLIPGLHKRTRFNETLMQIILIVSGVVLIYLMHSTLHQ